MLEEYKSCIKEAALYMTLAYSLFLWDQGGQLQFMSTSLYGIAFQITGSLWVEFTDDQWFFYQTTINTD